MKVSPWDIVKIWWHIRKVKRLTDRRLGPQDFLEASFAINAPGGDAENAGYIYAVGAITVNWASIELCLDVCNTLLIHHNKTPATRTPQNLGAKLRVFRNAFQGEPTLTRMAESAADLISEIERLREIRHDIIHGIVIAKSEAGERSFHRFTFTKNIGERRIQNYTFEQILNHLQEMLHLRGRIIAFTDNFNSQLDTEESQKARS